MLAALPPIALLGLVGLADESHRGPDATTKIVFGAWLLLVVVSVYVAARRRAKGRLASLLLGVSSLLAGYALAVLALLLLVLLS